MKLPQLGSCSFDYPMWIVCYVINLSCYCLFILLCTTSLLAYSLNKIRLSNHVKTFSGTSVKFVGFI